MREYYQIELTQGQVALVSPEDFEELSKYKWFAWWNACTKSFYAVRNGPTVNGKRETMIKMHRQIMGAPVGMQVDHIHGDTLDNRRSELRVVTHLENAKNAKMRSDNTSGFKGVHWHKMNRKWYSCIRADNHRIHIGHYETPEAAHAAYCEASRKYHGVFGRIS